VKSVIQEGEKRMTLRITDAFDCYRHFITYFDNNQQEKTELASIFTFDKRYSCFATSDYDEFQRLRDEGHPNIIYTNRNSMKVAGDTETYTGSDDFFHVFSKGQTNATNGKRICSFRRHACFCSCCRSVRDNTCDIGENCQYKDAIGNTVVFERSSKTNKYEGVKNRLFNLHEFPQPDTLDKPALEAFLSLLNIPLKDVKRLDNNAGNKKRAPRKIDIYEHLKNACCEIGPWAAVQERIQHNWQQNNNNPEEHAD
jgi:hypothetical protein